MHTNKRSPQKRVELKKEQHNNSREKKLEEIKKQLHITERFAPNCNPLLLNKNLEKKTNL
jgi:hypothetical protein